MEMLTPTFRVVVSTEMAPCFHILVYTITANDYIVVADSAFFPLTAPPTPGTVKTVRRG